jgi:hypothetical protein
MLINRASGDAGRFAEKLTGEQFAALPCCAAAPQIYQIRTAPLEQCAA